jgi:DEAD/DEAH box helicase domain-containing protein
VAVVGLMIEPRDLGHTLGDQDHPEGVPAKDRPRGPTFDPSLFLFDHIPGGVGLAPRIYDERAELFARAHRLLSACPCKDGCPTCIGPAVGGEVEGWDRKSILMHLLARLGLGSATQVSATAPVSSRASR